MDLELLRIVASGTYGTVCLAWDRPGWRVVALKVLRERYVENQKVLRRLADEARLLERLAHPNIVQVETLFERGGRPVLLMEWVRGVALFDLLPPTSGGLPPGVAIEVVRAASEALHSSWTTEWRGRPLRVIHRDIKTNNLLLDIDGVPKVVDFGIARGDFEDRESETLSMVLGARPYLAPERLDGSDDRPQQDTYALGFVLFELLTGQLMQLSLHPLHHRQALDRWLEGLEGPAGLVEDLSEAIRSMCSYLPDDRPSHGQVVARLTAIQERHGLSADLRPYGQHVIAPLVERQGSVVPYMHPDWDDLAQLFGSSWTSSDARLRSILSVSGWHTATRFLDDLLLAMTDWTAAPFLEILRKRKRALFRRASVEPEALLAALHYASRRMDPDVVAAAADLQTHLDPRIAQLARRVLERADDHRTP